MLLTLTFQVLELDLTSRSRSNNLFLDKITILTHYVANCHTLALNIKCTYWQKSSSFLNTLCPESKQTEVKLKKVLTVIE
jgi:hypothetical protein